MRRGDISALPLPEGTGHDQAGVVRPEIMGTMTRVLVEHVGAVNLQQLGDLAGHITPEEQWGVDAALLTVLDLN